MKRICWIVLFVLPHLLLSAKDVLSFGNPKSEQKHAFKENQTISFVGGMGESARKMLPLTDCEWKGGTMSFQMNVDAEKQNYFTVRCWGNEADETVVMLFVEGKQVGYRHLGDYDLLHRGNGKKPCPGRFYYYTLPIPIKYTKGKNTVNLELRSYGRIWGYGGTFEAYQKAMDGPTIGFYKAYVHTEPCFVPDKNEKQGYVNVSEVPIRNKPNAEILDSLKKKVSERVLQVMKKDGRLGQQEIWLIADAYSVAWTPAFRNPEVVRKVIKGIDEFYDLFLENPEMAYRDDSVYNPEWMTTCLMARSIRALWNEIKEELDKPLKGVTRKDAWSQFLKVSLDFGTTHRRHYTNQSMIIDMALYECNKAMMLLNPQLALPEYQTLRYLYESLALAPWQGKMMPNGEPEKPLGSNYWQLTAKGLTKELGYVGYYGEVLDWVNHIYKVTSVPGIPDTGDAKIKDQLLRIADARYNFRYPAVDNDGYRCYVAEAVVGWRDPDHYPGDIIYGDRGSAWDATPIMTAACTLDKKAIGIAQQMIADNQCFHLLAEKVADVQSIRTAQSCLHIPDEYEWLVKQPKCDAGLPMASEAPDYVFADEEDGVVAIKNGDEIMYVSLYWRARFAINGLAKVHYITPEMDRIANVYVTDMKYQDSGLRYVRPDWVNLGFGGGLEWYEGIHSAHAGESLPIAPVPSENKYKLGDENIHAGKADFYYLEFGHYVIAMNSSSVKTEEMTYPIKGKRIIDLTNGKKRVTEENIRIEPLSTVVWYVE